MSWTKWILIVRGIWPPLIAVAAVLVGLGQIAAQPPSQRLDLSDAPDGPMRRIAESRATGGQQKIARLPSEFHPTLQAADELAAALSTANEKAEAFARATKAVATELYRRLEATKGQRDRLSATLVDVQGKLSSSERRRKELTARVVALGEETRQSEARIAGLNLELEASEQRRRQLEEVGKELAQLKDELLSLRRLLKTANVALARAEDERAAARTETESLRAEVAGLLKAALATVLKNDQPPGTPAAAGLTARENSAQTAPMASSP